MKFVTFVGAAMALCAAIGCGQAPTNAIPSDTAKVAGHSHDGWWCAEHGLPEGIDAECHEKLAKEYKAKGDWCSQHDRPESQCFICHPELQAKFAALYEAKYGAKPPKPELQ